MQMSSHACMFTYKHAQQSLQTLLQLTHIDFSLPGFSPISSRSCAAWCVYFVVLCLSEDRTGRDKGSSVGVFTANTAEENSCRRRKGRGLMAGPKQPDHFCCEKSPQSQEREGDTHFQQPDVSLVQVYFQYCKIQVNGKQNEYLSNHVHILIERSMSAHPFPF